MSLGIEDSSDEKSGSAKNRLNIIENLYKTAIDYFKNKDPCSYRSLILESGYIDEEIHTMISDRVISTAKFFSLGNPCNWREELNIILRSLIYYVTVWKNGQSLGQSCLQMKYVSSGSEPSSKVSDLSFLQKLLLFFGQTIMPYIISKFKLLLRNETLIRSANQQSLALCRKFIAFLENIYKLCDFFNYLAFIRHGSYRTSLERMCGIRVLNTNPTGWRTIGYEVLRSQVILTNLTEMMLILIPIVKPWISKKLAASTHDRLVTNNMSSNNSIVLDTQRQRDGLMDQEGERSGDEISCPLCLKKDILYPYSCVPCGHVYCYFCLASRMIAPGGYHCARCNEKVQDIKKYITYD